MATAVRRLVIAALGACVLAVPAVARAGDPVMEWNNIARQLIVVPALSPVQQTRAMAIVHVAVHDYRVATGRPDRDVGAATEADHAGLGRQGHERGGQSRVHGVAAVGGHRQPGVDGLLAGGGDGDPADVGHVAHLGPRPDRARARPSSPGAAVRSGGGVAANGGVRRA